MQNENKFWVTFQSPTQSHYRGLIPTRIIIHTQQQQQYSVLQVG